MINLSLFQNTAIAIDLPCEREGIEHARAHMSLGKWEQFRL